MMDERALVEGAMRGERPALHALVSSYERLVAHVVRSMVRDPGDREDLCQETFLRVLRGLSSYRFQARLSSWIGTIAYNLCVNHYHRRRIVLETDLTPDPEAGEEPGRPLDAHPSADVSAEERLAQSQVSALIEDELLRLAPLDRTVIVLYYQDELSQGEIAEITGLSVDAVKIRMYRVRQRLRSQLARRLGREET